MFNRMTALLLMGLLLQVSVGVQPASAATKAERQAAFAIKVKLGIQKLGTGEVTHVKVKLKDKTKLEGFISEIGEDSFTVTSNKSRTPVNVAYTNVSAVSGTNIATGIDIALKVTLTIFLVIIIVAIISGTND